MTNHASTRTTPFYDRRRDQVSLDEVEFIAILGGMTNACCSEQGDRAPIL
jgi:hypothetical protein